MQYPCSLGKADFEQAAAFWNNCFNAYPSLCPFRMKTENVDVYRKIWIWDAVFLHQG